MFKLIILLIILLLSALLYSFSNEDNNAVLESPLHNIKENYDSNTTYEFSKKKVKEKVKEKVKKKLKIVENNKVQEGLKFIEDLQDNNISLFRLNSYLQMMLIIDYENKKYYLKKSLLRDMKTVKIINNIDLDNIPIEDIPGIIEKDILFSYISFLKKEIPVKLKPDYDYHNFANVLDFYNYNVDLENLEDFEIENMLYDYIEDFKIYAEKHKSSFDYNYYNSNDILDLISKIRGIYFPLPKDIKTLLNRVENKVSSVEIIFEGGMFYSIKRIIPLFKMNKEEQISRDYYTALKIIEKSRGNILKKNIKKKRILKNIFQK